MRIRVILLAMSALLACDSPAKAVDYSKIDRTIAKEPAYQKTPGYLLLVIGPKAQTRVWLVLDGEVLYVDRNANGDLTEPGERIRASAIRSGPDDDKPFLRFAVGEIVVGDGPTRLPYERQTVKEHQRRTILR